MRLSVNKEEDFVNILQHIYGVTQILKITAQKSFRVICLLQNNYNNHILIFCTVALETVHH